ncbi:MAG: hypothetical protein LBU22_02035 [Dysgonamonadaceae bacterium]|nr:hypothetical protein [Dysgonamonadaceae bacterium]
MTRITLLRVNRFFWERRFVFQRTFVRSQRPDADRRAGQTENFPPTTLAYTLLVSPGSRMDILNKEEVDELVRK